MRFSIRKSINNIFHFVLAPLCILCNEKTQHFFNLCEACIKDLPSFPLACKYCGRFITAEDSKICGACLQKLPPFDRTFALFPYEFPINHLITQLKFHHQLTHAKAFADLFMQSIKTHWYQAEALPDRLLPVPLHVDRLRERGFNQAVEIAKPIARYLKIPLDHGIMRVKPTIPQSDLPADKRKKNMAHAFKAIHNYTGLHIAVIDDVVTTGYTVFELCKELKRAGAKKIDVWCCARRG